MEKILIFGMSDNLGGVESVIMNYYRNIDKRNIQFDFLYNTKTIAYKEEIEKLGGKVFKITPRGKNIKKYKSDINDFFKNHAKEYSAIWVNLCILSNIDWLKYAKKYGIKVRIIHSHNSKNMVSNSKLKYILHKINKLFIKKYATDFWACSNEAGKWFYNKKIMNSDKYKIINNAIDLKEYEFNNEIRNEYRKKLKLEGSLVIGHIGRMHFQKNQSFLIDIFNEINKINNNTHLLLIGSGEDEEKIKSKVKKLNLENKVTFLGLRKDVKNWMQAMDVFVFPSLFEGLGIVLVEAQANGMDIYASKEGVPPIAKMSENFEFISLNQSAKKWAETILAKNHVRRNNAESIRQNGYDILEESKKIEKEFMKLINEEVGIK